MDEVEKVKGKLEIADVIQEYIPLKRSGRNFKAQCPFHQEKTPSFVVSPDRQIWHCFGCGKGGDVITFVMEYERIEFPEALRFLAQKAGVKLASPVYRNIQEKKRETIYSLNSLAAQFYHYVLLSHPAGKKARSYVQHERNISEALVKTFQLGYAPASGRALRDFLIKKKGYTQEDLLEAGLAFRRGREVFDFFRNRLMFPIIDSRGNIIAFSGRALNQETMPKYVNTKETLVYKKGQTFFGLNVARDAIKQEDKVILVEGEFDVISCFGEGIKNVVAVKGTALTEEQIQLIKRYAHKIAFCFDTDSAGTEAQRRSIELIEKHGATASVILPPQGKDPDELIHENPILFKKAIKTDIHVYDFIINSSLNGVDPSTVDGKRSVLAKTLPYLAIIENEVIKEHYFKKLANVLDTSYEALTREGEKIKKPQKVVREVNTRRKNREEILEEYLLALVVQSEDVGKAVGEVQEVMGNITFLSVPIARIIEFLEGYAKTHERISMQDLAQKIPSELVSTLDTSFLAPLPEFENAGKYTQELVRIAHEVKTLAVREQLKRLSEEIKIFEKNKEEKKLLALQEKFQQLTSKLR